MEHWREVVEGGVRELRRDFGAYTLVIGKTGVPGAWACVLPNGKRVVGELRTVRRIVDQLMGASRP